MRTRSADARLVTAVLWERLDEPGLEHCRLWDAEDSFFLEGRVLTVVEGAPAEVRYEVRCGRDWRTRVARVALERGALQRRVELRRDHAGRWVRDGAPLPEMEGLDDVDLGITPATNTMPIRRLRLAIGGRQDVDAVWLRFPELELERLPQRYARLAEHRYRYESGGGAFAAELSVDRYGLVTRYGALWASVAASAGTAPPLPPSSPAPPPQSSGPAPRTP